MNEKSSTYSFLNVIATLDGLRVQGGWDGDDAIQITPGVDNGAGMVGADGSSIFSQTANKSATIVLRLQHTSPTHRQLVQKYKEQRAGRLNGFPFDVKNLSTGEGGTTDQAFIQIAPGDQFGNNAVVRQWTLWTGIWEPNTPNA